jgi:hypothetical protein
MESNLLSGGTMLRCDADRMGRGATTVVLTSGDDDRSAGGDDADEASSIRSPLCVTTHAASPPVERSPLCGYTTTNAPHAGLLSADSGGSDGVENPVESPLPMEAVSVSPPGSTTACCRDFGGENADTGVPAAATLAPSSVGKGLNDTLTVPLVLFMSSSSGDAMA